MTVANVFFTRWCNSSKQKTLQALGRVAFRGRKACLFKEGRRIDASLFQQITKGGILGFESLFVMSTYAPRRNRSR